MKRDKEMKKRKSDRRKAEKEAAASFEPEPTVADLLAELSTFNSVSAWNCTTGDHNGNSVPSWAEIMLELVRSDKESPGTWVLPMRRHDGELIIEVLYKTLHPNSGLSITQMLWAELDDVIDRLMSGDGDKIDRGMAKGLGLALAILTAPYAYDEDHIRETAMERWEARNQ